jgi:CubicO group peptidase (beta-lactamase class C family)
MKAWFRVFVLVMLAGLAPAAQQLPSTTAESAGISTQRLDRLHKGMQGIVDRREASGLVTLVARDGKIIDLHATGFQDVESKTLMRTDTIFRIASMTKPITSVAIMILYEEGKLQLNDPVTRFIPAFKGAQVLGPQGTVPARRAITIRDLLTHRSGITYGFLSGAGVGEAYRKNGVVDGLTVMPDNLEVSINKLAAQPLMSQPGEAFNYSLSTDVLGRVVEVASGQPFDVFLQQRIFTPLRMVDTSFVVPDAKWRRLATAYAPDGSGGIRPMRDPESFGNTVFSPGASYKPGKTYMSGGAGLTSTASDYARFAQMLLGGGAVDGVRILGKKSIELMTMSHTADLPGGGGGLIGAGGQFGLGFRIVTDVAATQVLGSAGMYGWSGIYGTNFWVDPEERLIGIVMVQRYPGSTAAAIFQPLVYQAIVR